MWLKKYKQSTKCCDHEASIFWIRFSVIAAGDEILSAVTTPILYQDTLFWVWKLYRAWYSNFKIISNMKQLPWKIACGEGGDDLFQQQRWRRWLAAATMGLSRSISTYTKVYTRLEWLSNILGQQWESAPVTQDNQSRSSQATMGLYQGCTVHCTVELAWWWLSKDWIGSAVSNCSGYC